MYVHPVRPSVSGDFCRLELAWARGPVELCAPPPLVGTYGASIAAGQSNAVHAEAVLAGKLKLKSVGVEDPGVPHTEGISWQDD